MFIVVVIIIITITIITAHSETIAVKELRTNAKEWQERASKSLQRIQPTNVWKK